MRILTSNDDGIHAPGLKAMVSALKNLSFVDWLQTVAPDRDRSAASNSLTLDSPLHLTELEPGRACVNGTPTDCVHLALTGWLDKDPDIVVSGINAGSNLGDDILYSGTVAAATEGRFLGYPAVAVSLAFKEGDENRYYETAGIVLQHILTRLHKSPLSNTTVLNINVPNVPIDKIQGIEVTRLGHRHRAEPVIKMKDPRGKDVYWVGPAGNGQDAGKGTDFHAIAHSKVSITPLQVDLTQHEALEEVNHWASAFSLATDII